MVARQEMRSGQVLVLETPKLHSWALGLQRPLSVLQKVAEQNLVPRHRRDVDARAVGDVGEVGGWEGAGHGVVGPW